VIALVTLGFVCLAGASIVWSTLRLGISPMPSGGAVRRALLEMVPVELEGEVHELGAGWGTLAFAVARRCPKAKVIAWEASPVPFLFCSLRSRLQHRPNLELRFADFHGADLTRTRLVIAYLFTGAMTRLSEHFERELPTGAEVLTHTFAWRGRVPRETRQVDDLYRTSIWRYEIAPAETMR
jgi:cyclopropane fatty-acyl-phospholipid synthase-like methyltransferase